MPVLLVSSFSRQTPDSNLRPLDASLIVLPLFVLGFLLARFAAPVFALLPSCTFHAAFGFPCPSCGATRAGLALAQGELFTAFRHNPLFVVCIGILSIWNARRWLEILSGREINRVFADKILQKFLQVPGREELSHGLNPARGGTFYLRASSKWLRWLTISAIVSNWLYLIISE